MTIDTLLGVAGIVTTVLVALVAIVDARWQRKKREKAVIVAHSVVDRTYGLLLGIKPSVASLGAMHLDAVNDGLEAINQQRDTLADL